MKRSSKFALVSTAVLMTAGIATAALATGKEVKAMQESKYGKVLTDKNGMNLYIFTADQNGKSNCYNGCAAAWPPFVVDGKPQAGPNVHANLLGTTKRKDGGMQVTYKGMPLYYFAKDNRPGDAKGEGFKGKWYLISPAGNKVKG